MAPNVRDYFCKIHVTESFNNLWQTNIKELEQLHLFLFLHELTRFIQIQSQAKPSGPRWTDGGICSDLN